MPRKCRRTVKEHKLYLAQLENRAIREKYHTLLGRLAIAYGPAKAARLTGEHIDKVRYHKRKAEDPSFHPGSWGGER